MGHLADGEDFITNTNIVVNGDVPSNTAAETIIANSPRVKPTWTAVKYYTKATGALVKNASNYHQYTRV